MHQSMFINPKVPTLRASRERLYFDRGFIGKGVTSMLPGESGFTITFYTSFFKLLMISLMVLARFSAYFRNKAFCEPSHTVLLSAVRTILTVIGYELWPSVSTLASLNTDLTQSTAVSRSCPPPSQLKE